MHKLVRVSRALEAVQVMLSIKHNTRTDSSGKQSQVKFDAGSVKYIKRGCDLSTVCKYIRWGIAAMACREMCDVCAGLANQSSCGLY